MNKTLSKLLSIQVKIVTKQNHSPSFFVLTNKTQKIYPRKLLSKLNKYYFFFYRFHHNSFTTYKFKKFPMNFCSLHQFHFSLSTQSLYVCVQFSCGLIWNRHHYEIKRHMYTKMMNRKSQAINLFSASPVKYCESELYIVWEKVNTNT